MEDPNRISRLSQYRRNRRRFACIVYSLAAIFYAISILQWLLMIMIDGLRSKIIDWSALTIIALIISMIMVTAFVFFENLRFTQPINFFITLIIVLGTIWGISRAIVSANKVLFGSTVLFVIIVSVIFIMIGVHIEHDLTLDVIILFVAAVIFFVISVFLAMLQILAGVEFAFYIYSAFVTITVLMFMMYHAQTINGFRYAEMRINDYLLAALIIYHDMTLLLITNFYWINKIVILCGLEGVNSYGQSCCGNNETTTVAPDTPDASPRSLEDMRFTGYEADYPV